MNTYKSTKKKNVRPKDDGASLHISGPFAFRHDIHVGQTDFEKRLVETPPVSPPAPCVGSKDSTEDTSTPMENISEILKQEVIPALRFEIEDIIENKIRHLHTQTKYSAIPHCQTCSCSNKAERSELDLNHENTNIRRGKTNPMFPRRGSCTFVYNEDKKEVEIIAVSDLIDHGDGNFISTALNNPLYHTADQDILVQHGKKRVKYGSDLQLLQNTSLDISNHVVLARAHSLPGVTKSVQLSRFEQNDIEDNHRGRHRNKPDLRECMARALQCHVGELVDGIIFKDSELPDYLLADGCLTEEECSEVRQKLERRDQVRVLISMIKGRDLEILEKFLRHIRAHNNSLANKIEEKISQNQKEGVKCSMCALCSLTTQVNLKYIADALWQNSLVDDGMFNLIVHTDRPTGAQGDLWHRVINYLNSHKTSEVRDVLMKALTIKGHYHHIAKGVAWMINTNEELKCRCHLQKKIMPARSITSLASSKSPQSSELEFETDSQSNVSLVSTQPGISTVKGPSATRKEMNSTILPSVHTQRRYLTQLELVYKGYFSSMEVPISFENWVHSQVQSLLQNVTEKKVVDESQRNVTTMQEPRYKNTQEEIAVRVTSFIPKGMEVSSKNITHISDEWELKVSYV